MFSVNRNKQIDNIPDNHFPETQNNIDNIKLEYRDVIAMVIASYKIVLPIALIFAGGFALLLFLCTKVWLK